MKQPTNRVVVSVSIGLVLAVNSLPGTAFNQFLGHMVDRWIAADIQAEAMKTPKRDHVGSLEIEQQVP